MLPGEGPHISIFGTCPLSIMNTPLVTIARHRTHPQFRVSHPPQLRDDPQKYPCAHLMSHPTTTSLLRALLFATLCANALALYHPWPPALPASAYRTDDPAPYIAIAQANNGTGITLVGPVRTTFPSNSSFTMNAGTPFFVGSNYTEVTFAGGLTINGVGTRLSNADGGKITVSGATTLGDGAVIDVAASTLNFGNGVQGRSGANPKPIVSMRATARGSFAVSDSVIRDVELQSEWGTAYYWSGGLTLGPNVQLTYTPIIVDSVGDSSLFYQGAGSTCMTLVPPVTVKVNTTNLIQWWMTNTSAPRETRRYFLGTTFCNSEFSTRWLLSQVETPTM
eukprot:TRINITY_DN3119_c0_g1_i4.p1 TRINITY_DN3119_c0_g1~~TRINITY_DN3119_c0_g1_i4.p1  ORF type:complete len:336 (-),score=0.90 TRINITY_DN3119_c0_g1_i4:264-1271(-)